MKKVMKIDGMMCSHCTGTVSKVLNAIDGVTADVSLRTSALTSHLTRTWLTRCFLRR